MLWWHPYNIVTTLDNNPLDIFSDGGKECVFRAEWVPSHTLVLKHMVTSSQGKGDVYYKIQTIHYLLLAVFIKELFKPLGLINKI